MKSKRLKSIIVMGTLSFLILTMSACGKQNTASASSSNSSSSSGKKQLVLYSAQGYDKAVAEAFQKKTGINVKLVDDSTGMITAKMEAERSNPHWDVAWFDGNATMQAIDNEQMLLRDWTPSDIQNFTDLGKSLIPSNKSYYPVTVTAAAAIGVNTKLMKPADYPKDWKDLTDPKFKNGIAMNDPSTSGPTYPYVSGMLQSMGDTQGKNFYQNLKTNGLKVFPTNDNTLKALVSGQVKAITIQNSALINAKKSGDPVDIIYPSSGVFTLPGVISINKNAPDMDAAKQFVEYCLSPEGQSVMLDPKNGGGDSYFNPVIKGVQANKEALTTDVKWITTDPIAAAKNEKDIKKWFHDNILQ
ncbi:MAG: extracellular solute-binding protein [Clostridium sp.]|uniref:ABC transporter substrate-binding protein n=1 Tax=Clostridium sp. TaxID=1506 RepID=UPI0039ED84FE